MFEDLESKIGYKFQDIKILEIALRHSSTDSYINYERLEFLGDRVLGIVIADWLYKNYSDELPGGLAKRYSFLVSEQSLLKIANKLPLKSLLSKYNRITDISKSMIADTVESMLAVIYLEGGLLSARKVIENLWYDIFSGMTKKPPVDYKSELQEWSQKYYNKLPDYTTLEREGLDHQPVFWVKVSVNNGLPSKAKGRSIREAEKNAAKLLLSKLNG